MVAEYRAAYPDPLRLATGEEVTVGRRDDEWPDFLWCVNVAGVEGWVPDSFLAQEGERVVARRDYDATELSVTVGERLTIEEEVGGWLWCANERSERGWVPERNVRVGGSEHD